MPFKSYYVYILTNQQKTVLYTGVTNDLEQRIIEHWQNRGNQKSFTGRYYTFIYYSMKSILTLMTLLQGKKKLKAGAEVKKKH